MKDHEIVAVVRAHMAGETIESKPRGHSRNWESNKTDGLNFRVCEYRVKPSRESAWVLIVDGEIGIVWPGTEEGRLKSLKYKSPNNKIIHMVAVDD